MVSNYWYGWRIYSGEWQEIRSVLQNEFEPSYLPAYVDPTLQDTDQVEVFYARDWDMFNVAIVVGFKQNTQVIRDIYIGATGEHQDLFIQLKEDLQVSKPFVVPLLIKYSGVYVHTPRFFVVVGFVSKYEENHVIAENGQLQFKLACVPFANFGIGITISSYRY